MSAIRIRKTIDSDTLHLPELGSFLGHAVEIVIQDQTDCIPAGSAAVPGTGDWDAFLQAAHALHQNYDFDAHALQDARDRLDAKDSMK